MNLLNFDMVRLSHVVDSYRDHLSKFWTLYMIQAAARDHRDLLVAYAREPGLKSTLDKHNKKTFFNEAWDCLKGRFPHLRQLCGGLATTFPNTTSVEINFSLVQWEKDNARTSLTNLSLAGVMHAKQYAMLHQLVASDVVVEQAMQSVIAEAL